MIISRLSDQILLIPQLTYRQNAWNDLDALTYAGTLRKSLPSQQYTENSVFWLAQLTLWVMMLRNFPPFYRIKCHFRLFNKWVVDTSIVRVWRHTSVSRLMCARTSSRFTLFSTTIIPTGTAVTQRTHTHVNSRVDICVSYCILF